jgi:hypothetical protein
VSEDLIAEDQERSEEKQDRPGPYPEGNCYCGGPEEIYPHRYGTGYYCKREVARRGEAVGVSEDLNWRRP